MSHIRLDELWNEEPLQLLTGLLISKFQMPLILFSFAQKWVQDVSIVLLDFFSKIGRVVMCTIHQFNLSWLCDSLQPLPVVCLQSYSSPTVWPQLSFVYADVLRSGVLWASFITALRIYLAWGLYFSFACLDRSIRFMGDSGIGLLMNLPRSNLNLLSYRIFS